MSTFEALGWPDDIAVTLFGVAFVLSLAPYLSGTDFGIVKIPALSQSAKKACQFIGPIFLLIVFAGLFNFWNVSPDSKMNSPTEYSDNAGDNSSNEFIQILDFRANQIEKQLTTWAASTKKETVIASVSKILTEFRMLHSQNIEALRAGQLVRAHELTRTSRKIIYWAMESLNKSAEFENGTLLYSDPVEAQYFGRASAHAMQFSYYYPDPEYFNDMQVGVNEILSSEFDYYKLIEELMALLAYRASSISEILEKLHPDGKSITQEFLNLHTELTNKLEYGYFLESQDKAYEILLVLNQARILGIETKNLRYYPGIDFDYFDAVQSNK